MAKRLITFANGRDKKLDGRSRSACYEDIKFGRLPKLIKIGGRNYWLEDLLDEAIDRMQEQSNG